MTTTVIIQKIVQVIYIDIYNRTYWKLFGKWIGGGWIDEFKNGEGVGETIGINMIWFLEIQSDFIFSILLLGLVPQNYRCTLSRKCAYYIISINRYKQKILPNMFSIYFRQFLLHV